MSIQPWIRKFFQPREGTPAAGARAQKELKYEPPKYPAIRPPPKRSLGGNQVYRGLKAAGGAIVRAANRAVLDERFAETGRAFLETPTSYNFPKSYDEGWIKNKRDFDERREYFKGEREKSRKFFDAIKEGADKMPYYRKRTYRKAPLRRRRVVRRKRVRPSLAGRLTRGGYLSTGRVTAIARPILEKCQVFPVTYYRKLNQCLIYTHTQTDASSNNYITFALNSALDPYTTFHSRQALYYDQLKGLYNNCTVYAAKAQVI